MNKNYLTTDHVNELANTLAARITTHVRLSNSSNGAAIPIYGVPRGGIPAAYALAAALQRRFIKWYQDTFSFYVTSDPAIAHFIVDDIVDSGATRDRYRAQFPESPFLALVDKTETTSEDWYVFPWETTDGTSDAEGIQNNVRRVIQYVGDDPLRGGLKETPARVERALREWFSGYNNDSAALLKTFEDGAENYDEMITVNSIPFYSTCEHHMAPFFGTVTIGYIPNGRIVGLSKFARVVKNESRKLHVQERLTNDIANIVNTTLQPRGVGVFIRARHLCMESRGVHMQGHHTVTTALSGVLREASPRAEFLRQCETAAFKN